MEEEEDMPPFWLQTTDRRRRRLRRQASSIFLNSGLILLILLVVTFVIVFIIVPSIVSFISQIFKPTSIKKSWDSLNLVLVLFAIVCGFLGRNNSNNTSNNESTSYQSFSSPNLHHDDVQRSYSSRWYNGHDQYQDRTAYNTLNRLRSFSSYPDLRQESFWMSNDERWRFYDDTRLNSHWFPSSDQQQLDHRPPQEKQEEKAKNKHEQADADAKDIGVDTYVKEIVYTPPPPPQPQQLHPPSPPQPASSAPPRSLPQLPTKAVRRRVKRTYEDIGYEKEKVEKDLEVKNFNTPPPSHPPPPPPPPPPPVFSKREKKRGKDFLISLRRKRKKQRQKSVENLESLFDPQSSFYQTLITPHSQPPPPPPPPPPHFFQNLFSSKKSKAKKVHLIPPPPPPPPPPLTSYSGNRSLEARASKTTAQIATVAAHKPPKAVKTGGFSGVEENLESGNASPLIPIPPPPPPPPFKMTSWKFIRDGDYVRVASFGSSRSGSPDLDGEDPSEKESSPMSGDATMPIFCPSPDVNTKAENFIARFRAGLKMEKINSVKRSNLGPGSDTVEGEGPS